MAKARVSYIYNGRELFLNTAPSKSNYLRELCKLAQAFGLNKTSFPFTDFEMKITEDEYDNDRISYEYNKLAVEMFQEVIDAKDSDAALIKEAKECQAAVQLELERLLNVVMTQRLDMSIEMKNDNPLEDFPRSEYWRLVTDGWQQNKGINNFRDRYYRGMQEAFNYIKTTFLHDPQKKLTPRKLEIIHDLIYKFEKQSERDSDYIGFRDKIGGTFTVAPFDTKEELGLSKDGADEFLAAAAAAKNGEEGRWNLEYEDENLPAQDASKISKKQLLDFLNPNHRRNLIIHTTRITEEAIEDFLKKDLDAFYKAMDKLEESKNDKDTTIKKIELIVNFIRKLNQNHWFCDGNGRTCFLVFQLFMIQHLKCVAILKTPAHFTAHSTKELVAEVLDGMNEVEKYKITKAKKILLNLVDFEAKEIESKLVANLANENHIAMAQINELFLQVKENKIAVKKELRVPILDLLKKIYLEKLSAFCKTPLEKRTQKYKKCTFEKMLAYHEITKDFTQYEWGVVKVFKNEYFPPPPAAPLKRLIA